MLEAVVRDWADRFGLTMAEEDLLVTAVLRATSSRERLAEARGVSNDTVKAQVRAILRRTGMGALSEVSLFITREALRRVLGGP